MNAAHRRENLPEHPIPKSHLKIARSDGGFLRESVMALSHTEKI
jgi:hypothetical protein